MQNRTLYRILAYAGALPFVATALFSYFDPESWPWLVHVPRHFILTYALVILSFMCGVHWGTYLYKQEECPINLFLISNMVVIALWLGLILPMFFWKILIAILGFAILLAIDYILFKRQIITPDYWRTRRNVTAIVIVSLLIVLAA